MRDTTLARNDVDLELLEERKDHGGWGKLPKLRGNRSGS